MHAKPLLSAIVAMDQNRLIGQNNALPWKLSADLKHFKALTLGKPVIMGRKTWESIGRPLPGRENIVVSANANLSLTSAHVVSSIDAAIEKAHTLYTPLDEIMFIGGMMLYEKILPKLDRLYITEIEHAFNGDAWFPALDNSAWHEADRQTHYDETQGFHYHFITLNRHAIRSNEYGNNEKESN